MTVAQPGPIVVPIAPDTDWIVAALRVIARHANECAAELESLSDRQEVGTDETV